MKHLWSACVFLDLLTCLRLTSLSYTSEIIWNGTAFNVSRSFLDTGTFIGPRSLDVWFQEAEQKHDRLTGWEEELQTAGRLLEPATPAYLEWLSRRSSYNSRQLSKFALILEDVALQTARRTSLSRQQAAPELSLIDIRATTISAKCPIPVKGPCRAAQFRTFSGECNNVENPHWGKAVTAFSRSLPNAYADGMLVPRVASDGKPLPSAKLVSTTVHKDSDQPHKHVSHVLPFWAQLIEQDLSRSAVYGGSITELPVSCCHETALHPECFPIVDAKDRGQLQSRNVTCMNYVRSATIPSAGCRLGERQQVNTASHWLDGSGIYGSDDGFHSFFDDNGLLWMQEDGGRGQPPEINDITGCYQPYFDLQTCLASHAAKNRGSGYTPMMVLKTVIMREHNRIATELRKLNAHWDSAIIFQQARRIVTAEIQHITYKEFLPLVLGARSMDKFSLRVLDHDFYKNYSLNVNADIDNSVATAALKFWHKLVDNRVAHADPDGTRTTTLLSRELFRVSELRTAGGLDGYLRGMVQQPSQQKGAGVAFQLTKNYMQGPSDRIGLDLVSLTIQQGRDHGVAGYNEWRQDCGLGRADAFADFADNIPLDIVSQLKTIYRSVDDVDLYTGGLAEIPQRGALVGPVFACLLSRQFSKLRRGDRFWYEADVPPSRLTLEQLNEVRKTTLAGLICDNADNVTIIQPDTFLQPDNNMNAPGACVALPKMNLTKWKEEKPSTPEIARPTMTPVGANESDDSIHSRQKRQNFGFPRGNIRQGRQLQPVNQLPGNSGDNLCGEGRANCDPNTKFRTISGFCNNLNHPDFGTIDRVFSRFATPAYDDDTGEVRQTSVVGGALPPVRAIRTSVLTDVDRPHPKYTTMLMVFGQFIDHDMTNTPFATGNNGAFLSCRDCNSQQTVSADCRPIRVPQGDPVMASFDQGGRPLCLSFTRSMARRGNDGRRQQVNQLSSYLDGGQIYGTNLCSTRNLRSFVDGRMATTRNGRGQKDLLVQSTNRNDVESSECRSTGNGNLCFRAGDARSNEQPGLAVMHTIWAREHNLLAAGLKSLNSQWDDQRLFDETRRINVAILQHIIFNEWIPRVIGQPVTNLFGLALQRNGFYKDYDDTCDATISNEFSTAAFRFGHSLVPMTYGRYDNNFNRFKPINLFEHFSRSDVLYDDLGVDKLLIGFTLEPMQSADFSFSRALSDRLFQDPNKPLGTDLIAINLMRGRDHGIAGYNVYRERCNMTRARTFDDLLGDIPKFLVDKLASLYRHVDDIDLYAGGTSELPVVGGLVGPTFACIIAEQFLRLRKCDRFWYETDDPNLKFSKAQIASIRKMTMSKIVCENSDTINQVQREVFELPDTFQNAQVGCDEIPAMDLTPWQEVSGCAISGVSMQVGDTKRVSPCITCTCMSTGPDCRSLSIKSCADLAQDFTRDEILADDVCKVQCTKDFFDSAQDDDSTTAN